MARINQELLGRIASKLGVSEKVVYARIAQANAGDMFERHLAALKFAASLGINIQRYASADDLLALRTASRVGQSSIREVEAAVEKAMPIKRTQRQIAPIGKRVQRRSRGRDNSVFVVHGRNDALRRSMFDFLRALGLNPMEWEKAVHAARGANPYVGNILDAAMAKVSAVVVLFSPDDEAKLKEEFCLSGEKKTEGRLRGQARPNVIFEAGLALGRHPEKTLLVQVGDVRKISDIAGRHILHLSNDTARRNAFAGRLRRIIPSVSTVGSDWLNVGDFDEV